MAMKEIPMPRQSENVHKLTQDIGSEQHVEWIGEFINLVWKKHISLVYFSRHKNPDNEMERSLKITGEVNGDKNIVYHHIYHKYNEAAIKDILIKSKNGLPEGITIRGPETFINKRPETAQQTKNKH